MKRDIAALRDDQFDLVVVGAGIHGACAARDATLRGLKVAIVDKVDLGGGTSHNSLKTIHGGIRYLQHLNFKRTIESIKEQTALLRTAPHLVKPLEFVMPTYGYGLRGPFAMFIGLQLYYILCKLNRSTIPRGRILSRSTVRSMMQGLSQPDLSGAALWQEAQVEFADRAVIEILDHASTFGCIVANYVSADSVCIKDNKIKGVVVSDLLTGERLTISTRSLLNASGPSVSEYFQTEQNDSALNPLDVPLTKSMNLVLRKNWNESALAVQSQFDSDSKVGKSKRLFFIIPWLGQCIVGTTHVPHQEKTDELESNNNEIKSFIEQINEAYPEISAMEEDVLYCYRGFTPGGDNERDAVHLDHSSVVSHEQRDGVIGVFSIVGIKWTTARLVAEDAINQICGQLNVRKKCETAFCEIPAMPEISYSTQGLTPDQLKSYCHQHIEKTMAVSLVDMLLRRNNDLVTGNMSIDTIKSIAAIMTDCLKWTEQQQNLELEKLYRMPLPSSLLLELKKTNLWK